MLRIWWVVFTNPKFCLIGFQRLPTKLKVLFAISVSWIIILSFWLYASVLSGEYCALEFKYHPSYGRLPVNVEKVPCPDPTPRNYHFIFFRGGYQAHPLIGTWKRFSTLNISFYTETGSDPREPNVHRIDANAFIRQHRPHMEEIINKSSWVEKSDYLRYLAVAVGGGIYSDADVGLITPIREWLSKFGFDPNLRVEDLDFVVGMEFDYAKIIEGQELPFQLCQWVFAAKKGSYMMNRVVEDIEERMKRLPPSKDQDSVMIRTGPVAFTKVFVDEITKYGTPKGQNKGWPSALITNSIAAFKFNGKLVTLHIPNETPENPNGTREIHGVIFPTKAFGLSNAELTKHYFNGLWKGNNGTVNP